MGGEDAGDLGILGGGLGHGFGEVGAVAGLQRAE
jgi:hypothetical protein